MPDDHPLSAGPRTRCSRPTSFFLMGARFNWIFHSACRRVMRTSRSSARRAAEEIGHNKPTEVAGGRQQGIVSQLNDSQQASVVPCQDSPWRQAIAKKRPAAAQIRPQIDDDAAPADIGVLTSPPGLPRDAILAPKAGTDIGLTQLPSFNAVLPQCRYLRHDEVVSARPSPPRHNPAGRHPPVGRLGDRLSG
jgi:hypothetical protein